MEQKSAVIIGAGPIGSILAAHLISAGHEVMLVDAWTSHLETMRTNGLVITGKQELCVHPAHLYASIEDLGDIEPDFVFICTKACDLDAVLDNIGDSIRKSNAMFISFQNGIDTEQVIAERFGPGRVLRGILTYAGFLIGPGKIHWSFFNPPNYLGWIDESGMEACRNVAAMLSDAGLETEATGEIGLHVWKKAILNTCTMAIAAVTGMNMQEMEEFPPTSQLVDLLLHESIAVAAANGFDYGPGFFEKVKEFNKRAGPHRPSMLVDIENGRKTENAFIVRRIAEYAEKKGLPAPYHRTLAIVIDALEMRNRSKLLNESKEKS
jgi:2-dehydropantoate 2-reductase